MTRLLLALVALFLAGPALGAPRQPPVTVTLTQTIDGGWTADYRFGERASAWMFPRSAPDLNDKPWRQRSWTIETPGVRLERLGRYDALVAPGGVPRHVRLRFQPLSIPLKADYQPALRFSDGSVAIFTDHFTVAPQPNAAAVAALPFDIDDLDERPIVTELRAQGKRLLVNGTVSRDRATISPDAGKSYAYIGDVPLLETTALAGLIDPGLPDWAHRELDDYLQRLLDFYTRRLGTPAGDRPMAFVSYGGGARPGMSLSGSVLDGLVVMDVSGQQIVAPNPLVLDRLRWFFGHETAHFWVGHTIHYDKPSVAWITEGSADLLAIRAIGALAPGYDMRRETQREVDDCLKVNGSKPLSGASERGETRANYACGAVLMLAAEAVERRGDPTADALTFARRLLDRNRDDGEVTQREWLDAFAAASGDAALSARVAEFLDAGASDPVGFMAGLFTATGVGFTREGGKLTLR